MIEVVPAGADYATWATNFSLGGGPDDDDDNDGLSNNDEYAFGLDPTSGSSVNVIPATLDTTTGTFSCTRRLPSLTGLTYTYAYSTTLEDGSWTTFASDPVEASDSGDPVETIVITVPAAILSANPGRLFVQVIAE